jgi:hypothetical protein
MKNLSLITLSVLMLVFVGVAPLQAQSINVSGASRVNVPFQFNVGHEKFPAGDYLIAPVLDSSIRIQNISGGKATVVLTNWTSGGRVQGPKLVFNTYGDRHFLSQFWLHRSDIGRQLFVSAEEIEVARTVSQKSTVVMVRK